MLWWLHGLLWWFDTTIHIDETGESGHDEAFTVGTLNESPVCRRSNGEA